MADFAWIPEHPTRPLYRAREPQACGKLGELRDLLTADASAALHFVTREACEAWIAANPSPPFVAREHGFG
jgi:hypothetical protein